MACAAWRYVTGDESGSGIAGYRARSSRVARRRREMATAVAAASYLDSLESLIGAVIAPAASETDSAGTFPRAALDALGAAGLLGLVSAREVGGLGEGHRAAAHVVERIARSCASTAMIVCMHYAAAAVVEAHGPMAARRDVAAGRALATLAFSEAGSRSHFWAPVSTAAVDGDAVRLDAHKSWITAAGEADLYVWSSRPLAAEGASTLWLVPASAEGLRVGGAFDGLGLRGNASSPVLAEGVRVPIDAMLGADGAGFGVMMGVVLPYFNVMSAAMCPGKWRRRPARLRRMPQAPSSRILASRWRSCRRFGPISPACGSRPTWCMGCLRILSPGWKGGARIRCCACWRRRRRRARHPRR